MRQARANLVGSTTRVWVKDRVETTMGLHGVCTKGETYQFRDDGQVTVRKCIDGALTTRSASWTLKQVDVLDPTLAFDGKEYRLSFSGSRRSQEMRWRIVRDQKSYATEDILLRLSRD